MNKKDEALQHKANLEKNLKEVGAFDALDSINKADEILPSDKPLLFDFSTLRDSVNEDSKTTITNIVHFHFNFENLTEEAEKMVKARMEIDILSLHTIMYQLKTSDFAIGRILDEINNGATTNVRLFESLVGLQKNNLEATKALGSTITELEKMYKDLYSSIEDKGMVNNIEEDEHSNINRGTRNVIKDISNLEDEINILNNEENKNDE